MFQHHIKRLPLVIAVAGASLLIGCSAGEGVPTGQSLAESSKSAVPEAPAADFAAGSAAASTASNERTVAPQAGKTAPPVATTNRNVIQTANLTVRVPDVEVAERETTGWIQQRGGYVDSSEGSALSGETPSIRQTLKVPVKSFYATLDFLRTKGVRLDQDISTQDVTGQVADMGARINTMRAQEQSYISMLRKANSLNDHIALSDRLAMLRGEIEGLTAQWNSLKHQAALSTITVTWKQDADPATKGNDPNWLAESWGQSIGQLQILIQGIVGVFLFAFAMSPLWAPIVALFLWSKARNRKRQNSMNSVP